MQVKILLFQYKTFQKVIYEYLWFICNYQLNKENIFIIPFFFFLQTVYNQKNQYQVFSSERIKPAGLICQTGVSV